MVHNIIHVLGQGRYVLTLERRHERLVKLLDDLVDYAVPHVLQFLHTSRLHLDVLEVLHQVRHHVSGHDQIVGTLLEQIVEAIVLGDQRQSHQQAPQNDNDDATTAPSPNAPLAASLPNCSTKPSIEVLAATSCSKRSTIFPPGQLPPHRHSPPPIPPSLATQSYGSKPLLRAPRISLMSPIAPA